MLQIYAKFMVHTVSKTFVSMQHRTFYVKTCVRFIVAGDKKNAIKTLLCNTSFLYIVDSDM